jgi:hypothetical protein
VDETGCMVFRAVATRPGGRERCLRNTLQPPRQRELLRDRR